MAQKGEIRWLKYADTAEELLVVVSGTGSSLATLPTVGLLDSSDNYPA